MADGTPDGLVDSLHAQVLIVCLRSLDDATTDRRVSWVRDRRVDKRLWTCLASIALHSIQVHNPAIFKALKRLSLECISATTHQGGWAGRAEVAHLLSELGGMWVWIRQAHHHHAAPKMILPPSRMRKGIGKSDIGKGRATLKLMPSLSLPPTTHSSSAPPRLRCP